MLLCAGDARAIDARTPKAARRRRLQYKSYATGEGKNANIVDIASLPAFRPKTRESRETRLTDATRLFSLERYKLPLLPVTGMAFGMSDVPAVYCLLSNNTLSLSTKGGDIYYR